MSNRFSWKSPSNIALVKYWGKHGMQLPANPSISFTLSKSYTETSMVFTERTDQWIDFKFEGKPKPDFLPKIEDFFNRINHLFPDLKDSSVSIDSSNSFPHSSGIASSASAMSAMAMCLIEREASHNDVSVDSLKELASNAARLGSGSAARSVYGGFTSWGATDHIQGSSDEFAVQLHDIHPDFMQLQDTILLIDEGVKSVSSTVGHGLMNGHPFAEQRFIQARENIARLLPVLKGGNFNELADIMESEALSLHSMMMTSPTPYLLFRPGTIAVISRIMQRRRDGEPVSFTLDAGANVHMIYPTSYVDKAMQFIETELVGYCANGTYICDCVGVGPEKSQP